eukprot:TRINITY_DN67243_c5_g7_i2.p1 TRINITY_DN67243_c5_g7~~TRINITY_DN67243_c5_g7_i2.p1  ORF type:complete len:707 (-),score=92.32 TRINITY_DN67243_c5_g7_i2:1071-3191(-)
MIPRFFGRQTVRLAKAVLFSMSQQPTPEELAQVRPDIPYVTLKVKEAFEQLTPKEKLYAHYLSAASWYGYWISAVQTSAETPELLKLFLSLNLTAKGTAKLKTAAKDQGITDEEFEAFLQYVAACFSNCGNYLSFGDTKMLPRVSLDKITTIVKASANVPKDANLDVLKKITSFEKEERMLGLVPEGLSSYFSANCTSEDAEFIKKWMETNKVEPGNTRLWKTEKDGKIEYEIKTTSVETGVVKEVTEGDKLIKITKGDNSELAAKMVENFKKALEYASNDREKAMIEQYIQHYQTGDMEKFKQSQREWVKDVGPIVETNIGFVETYRDPVGTRAEHSAWVACVDKHQSKLYSELVNLAPEFIKTLPWPTEFERDVFKRPDFTALGIVMYGGSGVPLGINIPNFDDIRTEDGFKNVYLINVGGAAASAQTLTFLTEEDVARLKACTKDMDIQVAGHELLGHGSGKQFTEDATGKKNFSPDTINPLTKEPVATWYKPGESYDSGFGALASGWEECRAEGVGLFLSLDPKFLTHFGLSSAEEQKELIFSNWMKMVRNGIRALEFYNPELKKWGQAHMVARHVILRVLLEAGVVTLEETEGGENVVLRLKEEEITTKGKEAISTLLLNLNVCRATNDFKRAQEYWAKYATVDEYWMKIRSIALAHRAARFQVIYGKSSVNADGAVDFTEYPNGMDNLLQSYTDILTPTL